MALREAEKRETSAEPVSSEPTTIEKLRGLRWSIASNALNTVFVQFTFFGSIFVLFLNQLGLSKGQMGLVLSLLPFTGIISVFVAPAVARMGYKRAYITFFALRSVAACGLLLMPWIVSTYGTAATLTAISVIVAVFALLRSVGMTGNIPWVQEYVPNSVRGKYTANNNMATSLVGFAAVSVGGFVLGRVAGLSGFMALITAGIIAGFLSVWLASYIPGGAPIRSEEKKQPRNMRDALADRDFLRYLSGVGILTLATVPLASFLPLYMREQIGLDAGQVVFLQMGTLTGSIASSFLWGWLADRYGSKPVMLWGLLLRTLLPLAWVFMPRNDESSLLIALAISLMQGFADMGWGIGSARLLYVSVVPSAKKGDYSALYNAWVGIAGGVSQLLGGQILQLSQGLSGQVGPMPIDPYLPLFVSALVLPLVALSIMRRITADETLGMGAFAGIFFRGNPFLAMTSMMRFHLARDEHAAVVGTERLAQTRSPLAVEELLEALGDPRFNVRFEAVVAVSRMPPDPRLTEALINILHGTELALSAVAAWALGRIGDPAAYEPLRQGLDSPFRSLQLHSARALGALGKQDIAPLLNERIASETDKGLLMAYASALGNLQDKNATTEILRLLRDFTNEGARMELALSVARMLGGERSFVQLVRAIRSDPGTTLAQGVLDLKRRQSRAKLTPDPALDEIAGIFARGQVDRGLRAWGENLSGNPPPLEDDISSLILAECAARMSEWGAERIEYAVLALHVLA